MNSEFTHIAELYGFRCFYNIETSDVMGTNWYNDKMIELFIWLDVELFQFNEFFEIKLIREL